MSVLKPVYEVIGHVSEIANLERTDINRFMDNHIPHLESISSPSFKVGSHHWHTCFPFLLAFTTCYCILNM